MLLADSGFPRGQRAVGGWEHTAVGPTLRAVPKDQVVLGK